MTDQELRQLVRDAIAKQTGRLQPSATAPFAGVHASHAMFMVPAGADVDGPCIIEPSVECTHCGYCKSLGH